MSPESIAEGIERSTNRKWSHTGVPYDGLKEAITAALKAERTRAEKAEEALKQALIQSSEFGMTACDKMEKAESDLAEAVEALRGIINGCVHPDKAVRAVMVNLEPIRKIVEKHSKKGTP